MRKSEIILLSLAILSAYLKSISVPGGAFLTTILLGTLALFYSPMGFLYLNNIKFSGIFSKESYRDISGMQILGAIFIGKALAVSVVGALFTLQSWPRANLLLSGALMLDLVVGAIVFVKFFQTPTPYFRQNITRIGIWLLITILLLIF
ncbi:hypothetical protein [Flexibacter flexilis]|nr:hypothetical protein [Flexibacter flexilis]